MTLKLSVISRRRGRCAPQAIQAWKWPGKDMRSWLESLPQSLKLNFSLMMDISSRWPDRAATTRTTGSSGVMRPSCA